jgi:putative nucleotidyltransferase with HDIG domain
MLPTDAALMKILGDALAEGMEKDTHSPRVTAFTIAIARAMKLPPEKIRVIARGAYLHDIGLIGIPDAILRKPSALTPEETRIMREHCFQGYQMLRKIPEMEEVAEMVYSHQEHFDGSGYPRGLKAEQIPIGARIVAIADTLHAIISPRPHRAAQSVSVACREVERVAGRQFDPEIVRVFLALPQKIWSDLCEEIDSQQSRKANGSSDGA